MAAERARKLSPLGAALNQDWWEKVNKCPDPLPQVGNLEAQLPLKDLAMGSSLITQSSVTYLTSLALFYLLEAPLK